MLALGPSESVATTIERPLRDRVVSAGGLAMSYWYYKWDWGESIAFEGLDAAARTFDLPFLRDYVTFVVDDWITRTGATAVSRHGPARCLLRRHAAGGAERYLGFAKKVGRQIMERPRHKRGPYLLDPEREFAAVDSHYGEPAFLAELTRVTGEGDYAERAVAIALNHSRALQNEQTGLYRHFVDLASGTSPDCYWGRGNGWAALGLSDLLLAVPEALPGVNELRQRFASLCAGLSRHEVPGGGWRNLIDQPASYPESSSTAMIVAGATPLIARGILDRSHQPMVDRAWNAIAHRIDSYGTLAGVSYRPGINTDISRYEHTPVLGGGPWGQGSYLLAACQRA